MIQVLANEEKNVFAHWHVGETSSSYEVTYRSFPEAALYKYHVVQSSSSVMVFVDVEPQIQWDIRDSKLHGTAKAFYFLILVFMPFFACSAALKWPQN